MSGEVGCGGFDFLPHSAFINCGLGSGVYIKGSNSLKCEQIFKLKKSKVTVFLEDTGCLVAEEPVHGECSIVRCLKQNLHKKISNPTCMLPFFHLACKIFRTKSCLSIVSIVE